MDHIWLERGRQLQPDPVPLYGEVTYDGKGFHGFLERLRSDEEFVSTEAKESERSPKERPIANSLIQEWLFFGCLSEFAVIFDVEVDRQDFIRTQDGSRWLSTERLSDVAEKILLSRLRDWHIGDVRYQIDFLDGMYDAGSVPKTEEVYEDMYRAWKRANDEKSLIDLVYKRNLDYDAPSEEDLRKQDRIQNILRQSTDYLDKLVDEDSDEEHYVKDENWLSCWILAESLLNIAEYVLGTHELELATVPTTRKLWLSRGKKLGLCPQLIQHWAGRYPVTYLYLATSLPSHDVRDHARCTGTSRFCEAAVEMVDLPKHVSGCDGKCRSLTLTPDDYVALEDTLREGSLGVLDFTSDRDDCADFTLNSNVDKQAKFVAVSHVWAHGLGNPYENAMHECQLLALKRSMAKAGCGNLSFWLDTLCIPRNSPLRRQAISKMSEIYQGAAKVLVLDQRLLRTQGHPAIRMISLMLCDWMTRLWTLQEGLLPAERLCIAFADGVWSIGDLLPSRKGRSRWQSSWGINGLLIEDEIYYECQRRFLRGGTDDHLLSITEGFSERTTSRLEDEAFCLAIMVNVEVTDLPKNPRVHDVIARMPSFAQNIIFVRGPRTNVPGFRWLPASLMLKQSARGLKNDRVQTVCDGKGIRLTKCVARVETSLTYDRTVLPVFRRFRVLAHADDSKPYLIACGDVREESVPDEARCQVLQNPAFVFYEPPDEHSVHIRLILLSDVHEDVNGNLRGHYEDNIQCMAYDKFPFSKSEEEWTTLVAPPVRDVVIWVD